MKIQILSEIKFLHEFLRLKNILYISKLLLKSLSPFEKNDSQRERKIKFHYTDLLTRHPIYNGIVILCI